MQVIQTINDTIRILFSPIEEDFKLLDFLLVQEADNRYLAQIIEIYDDKYDASQNVARVKLFFKVNEKGEVFGYDHFTPSKECEIKKIKRDEILTFINEGKESLTIGLDYQSGEPFDINFDFLRNNPVIFADKIEQSNNISLHLANVLSRYKKHSVIFDFSGTIEIKKAKKLVMTKDAKLPLDFNSINYIWERGLSTASLETQAICREIFNEVQTFAKSAPEGFIPFKKFLDVIEIQYKATPIVELTVLLNKLNAYQKNNIFANRKKDFEIIKKSVEENEITIIDFSELKTSWHKEFCEFAIRNIENAFVFIRLNETNADADLINFIYDKKPNISLVPSISYTYSKMPHIIEHVNNYFLLPTLNPRRDFGAANFELASIAKDECILFGQNSENFIFTIKNDRFLNNDDTDKKTQKIINLKLNEGASKEIDLREKFKNRSIAENEYENTAQEQIPTEEELDFFEQMEIKNKTEEEKTLVKKPEESNVEEHYEKDQFSEEIQTPEKDKPEGSQNDLEKTAQEIQIIENAKTVEEMQAEEIVQDAPQEEYSLETAEEPAQVQAEEIIEQQQQAEIIQETFEPVTQESIEELVIESTEIEQETIEINENPIEETIETTFEEISQENFEDTVLPDTETIETTFEEISQTAAEENIEDSKTETETTQDVFQNILEESEQENESEENNDDALSLDALAAQSIENTFSEVIDKEDEETNTQNSPDTKDKLIVDENVVIDLEKIKEHIDTQNGSELPIFKNKSAKKEVIKFKTGDMVEHDKYGKGEVIKVINYANRSLLQINFEEVGKRLLDPDIANIRELQEE